MADESKVKGVVDLVFLLDASGSMKECIQAVRNNIRSFVDLLTSTDANSESPIKDWRIKVCGYRDHAADPSSWYVDNPFVRDVAAVQAQLDSPALKASGGGDEPESLLDALFKLFTMGESGIQDAESPEKWRSRGTVARVVAFFTDATFKEPMTIPEAAGGRATDLFKIVADSKFILCGFVPEWKGYQVLANAEEAFFVHYIEGAEVAHLGEATPEGKAASAAAIAAMNRLARDSEGFTKLMATLAKTVKKSAVVSPELC